MSGGRALPAAAGIALLLAAPAAAQEPSGSIENLEVDESVENIDVAGSIESLQAERQSGGRVTVTVAADVLFEFDKARLTPKAKATIERVGARMRSARGPVRVDGYTDSVGSDAYNLGLSRRRAAAVSAALRGAIPARLAIQARGHGESDPVAPNTRGGDDNPAGRAKNRRVTISYGRG